MIATSPIRNRILYLALRGDLVNQDASDGHADDLVSRISNEINGKQYSRDFDKTDIPFDIPSNWVWCKLSDIGRTNIGLTYHPEDVVEDGTIVVRSSNIINGKMDYSDLVTVNCPIKDNQYLDNNDIVICARNGSKALVGKCAIFEGNSKEVSFGAFMAVFRTSCYRFVYHYMNTPVFRRYFSNDDTKQINQVTQSILKNALIPVPPLEEQERICDMIEQIFAVLDTIDDLQAQYNSNIEALKGKLIAAGIQGKLTTHLPEDGTAEELYTKICEEKEALIKEGKIKKEKTIPEIRKEEIPFSIPENWKWVRLCNISNRIWAGGDKPKDFTKEKDGKRKIPVVANGASDEGILGYTEFATASKDTITVAGRGTIGFAVYRTYDYCPIVRLIVIEQSKLVEPRYLRLFLESMPESSVGSSIPQLTVPMIKPKLIPLPPLAEQVRIADKVDEFMVALSESLRDEVD